MGNKFKDIHLKEHTYYFSDDMINIKHFDSNKIKIDKTYKNILIYYVGYVMVKDLRSVKINSVNSLYLIIIKINGYIEDSDGNKYLMLVPNDESKDTLKVMKNYGPK